MTINIRQNLVAASKYDIKAPYTMTPNFITVHNTANDASAENEITYMIRNDNQVSFHFAVDDKEAVQGLPLNRNGWHSGDGVKGDGNRQSIAVEICYSKSGGDRFTKAEQNAAWLVAELMKDHHIPITHVRTHQSWNGKYCPHRTLNLGWQHFLNMVQAQFATNGSTANNNTNSSSSNQLDTNSIVDWMNANGMDSSFANRAILAAQFGINNYTGTAAQNTQLLSMLRNQSSAEIAVTENNVPSVSYYPIPNYAGASLVEALNQISVDSSFINRQKIAAKNEIKNYMGTAVQNTQLLNLLKQGQLMR